MNQPNLFNSGGDAPRRAPFQAHSSTSRAAAAKIAPKLNELERLVLDAIRAAPEGLTDEEGRAVTGLSGDTYRPRRVKLGPPTPGDPHNYSLIRTEGERRGASGRSMAVWRAV